MDDGSLGAHVDPQANTDFDRNGDPIKIRQSKFLVLEPSAELREEVDQFLGNRTWVGLGGFNDPDFPKRSIFPLVFNFLKDNPQTVDFIVDHVIAKSEGHISGELREEILGLLDDMDLWVFGEEFMVEDEQFRISNGVKDKASRPDVVHVDATPDLLNNPHNKTGPEIRITIPRSRQKATVGFQGWFATEDYERGGEVSAAQGSELSQIDPKPGSAVIWELFSGVHKSPELSDQEWDEIGGTRGLYSISIDFHKLIYRAKQNIEDRRYIAQAADIPAVPLPTITR